MAKLETLKDRFPSLDTGVWNNIGNSAVTGSKLRQTPPAQNNYAIVDTQSTYQLDESYIIVKVDTLGAGWTNSNETILKIYETNNSNDITYWNNGTSLTIRVRTSAATVYTTSLTYSSSSHAWLRIREASGTLYFDTSANGITWTNRGSTSTPAWVGTTDTVKVRFQTGWYGTGTAGSPVYSEWDNVNSPPNAKVWDGSAWVTGVAKVWDGSAWVSGRVKVWNGSAWA